MPDRTEDMGTAKRLRVIREDEGDVIVSVVTGRGLPVLTSSDGDQIDGKAEVQFCTPFSGGGHSPKTWAALIALMKAMEEDEGIAMIRRFIACCRRCLCKKPAQGECPNCGCKTNF